MTGLRKIKSIGVGVGKIDGTYTYRLTQGEGRKSGTVHTRMDLLENCHRMNNIFVMELYGD